MFILFFLLLYRFVCIDAILYTSVRVSNCAYHMKGEKRYVVEQRYSSTHS